MDIKQLIFELWSGLERTEGKRIALKELADRVGIEYSSFNKIYNLSRPPTKEQIESLFDYFQDPRFYDVAGLPRPDLTLLFVMRKWGSLSEDKRSKIMKILGIPNSKGDLHGKDKND